jgi:transcriptional regulator GlxA family with amidase domain
VVQDNVVTSQGPGTALQFALTLGESLYGKEMADKVAKGLLVSLS